MAERKKVRDVETSFYLIGSDDQEYDIVSLELEEQPTEKQEQPRHQIGRAYNDLSKPGLVTRFGRGVKSAVGGAISLGKTIAGVGQSQDVGLTFVDVCKKVIKTLTLIHSKHGECVIPSKVVQAMSKTSDVLDLKDICISVFGQHNCGKSTLLNALIGEDLLPVFEMNETSVKIKVQHDDSVHRGVCSRNCAQLSRSQSKTCPKLQVFKRSGKHEIKGAEAIYDHLLALNKDVRRHEKGINEAPTVVLKVNIPLLADKVPAGWTVSLVDNPGFGEAKEHVVQLADASLITSSAYIYLIQTENIGGTEAADFFKELTQKDNTAMKDGRLAVGVTKFDTNYTSSISRRRSRRSNHITVEKVKENMIASIKDATGSEVSEDTIVPLCGEWALAAGRLANCLISDPEHELQERKEDAISALEKYPHLSLPGGQQQTQKELIQSLSSKDLIKHLENASGICDLKSRIHFIVGNACVKVWATKAISELNNYLQAGKEGIERRCRTFTELIAENEKDHLNAQELYNKVLSTKEDIKATAPKKKKQTTSNSLIWKEFEISYQEDLNKYKPQEEGKAKVRDLVKEFKEQCQFQIAGRHFGPDEFEQSIHLFLKNSEPKLQRVFDTSCGFWNVQSVLMKHVEIMVERITKLRLTASILCRMDSENTMDESHKTTPTTESRGLSAPNLADIKLRVKIPSVSLRWWEKIVMFFRSLRVDSGSRLSQSEDPGQDRCPLDSISSPITSLPPEQSTVSSSEIEESQSDSDEDDDENDVDPVYPSDVELKEVVADKTTSSADVDSDTISNNNSTLSSTCEEESEHGGSRQRTTTIYRKWNKELDDAILVLQDHMEGECDKYFEAIKPRAIKFFYRDYKRKVTDRLNTFDKDYGAALEEEHKRLKKLRTHIELLKKEYYELREKLKEVQKLSDQLLTAYSYEFVYPTHEV